MTYRDADWQYEQITSLSQEVENLQYQLNTYHEWLEICLERDREKQLRLTWHIYTIAMAIGAAGMTTYILQDSYKALSVIGAVFAYIATAFLASKLEESELKGLPPLPKWKPKT